LHGTTSEGRAAEGAQESAASTSAAGSDPAQAGSENIRQHSSTTVVNPTVSRGGEPSSLDEEKVASLSGMSNLVNGTRVPPEGRLTMCKLLGSGAQGMVCLAKDEKERFFVAKSSLRPAVRSLIPEEALRGAPPPISEEREKYRKIHRRLGNHPQIPCAWESDEMLHNQGGTVTVLTLDYRGPDGTKFSRVLAAAGSENRAALGDYLGRSLYKVVSDLWSVGISHNDLKDDNITLDETCVICIADLGSASLNHDSSPLSEEKRRRDMTRMAPILSRFGIHDFTFLSREPLMNPDVARALLRNPVNELILEQLKP
jgi:hypothetical protein